MKMTNRSNTKKPASKRNKMLSLLLAALLAIMVPGAAFADIDTDATTIAADVSPTEQKVVLPDAPASPAAPKASSTTDSADALVPPNSSEASNITAQAGVCAIGSTTFSTFESALAAFRDGDTITLLVDIEYYKGISFADASMTIRTNGCGLNVRSDDDNAIYVSNGEFLLDDSSGGYVTAFSNSDSLCAVYADGSRSLIEVSNAFGRLFGAYADGGRIVVKGVVSVVSDQLLEWAVGAMAINGGRVTVQGDIHGVNFGAYAENSGQIFARSNVTAMRTNPDTGAIAAMTRGNCIIEILGYALGVNYGVYAENGYIYVGGDARATKQNSERSGIGAAATNYGNIMVCGSVEGIYCGAYSQGASVTVLGSSLAVNNVTDMAGYGAVAVSGGQTTIEGNVTASCTAVRAYDYGSCVLVRGFASCPRLGASASDQAKVQVDGSIPNSGYRGVEVTSGALALITGHVTGGIGIYADGAGSEVYLNGSVSCNGNCVYADNGAKVTVDGELYAGSSAVYVTVDKVAKTSTSYQRVSSMPGYLEYSQNGSFVWVRTPGITTGAPGSGDLNGDGYVTMDEAMAAARAVVGSGPNLYVEQRAALDMDADGYVTMTDVLLIMRKALGI